MRARDGGSATIEFAVGFIAIIALLGALIAGGRISITQNTVQQAAAEAARAASLSREATSAATLANEVANATLTGQDLTCVDSDVTADVAGFFQPPGSSARVTVTVSCTVSLADAAIPGLPGIRTFTAEASSALDTYRGR